LVPACQDGAFQLVTVGPRVACRLSPDLAERQAVSEPAFRGDPGVCQQGDCVPRLLCVERCGRALGEKYGPELFAEVEACRRARPEAKAEDCAAEVELRHERMLWRIGEAGLRCFDDCGLPSPNVPSVPRPLEQ
jgi:hypothetical protein